MVWYCAILAAAAAVAAPDNLLTNPSFEAMDGDAPVAWKSFVEPQAGAEASVDAKVCCDGDQSVRLHNPGTYATDPANNWSQNLTQALAGKTLILGGVIKTEQAGGAALWLQCWQREPWRVLSVATTSDEHPVTGTKDWTPVALKTQVPKDTDYVVVRCVIKGGGTVWFDDLRLVDAGTETSLDDEIDSLREKTDRPKRAREADKVKREILRDSDELTKSVKELRDTNDSLLKEIATLRTEIKDLRGQVRALPKSTRQTVPPLVPHGYDQKEFQ